MQEIAHLLEPGQVAVNLEQLSRNMETALKAGVGAEAGLMFAGAADSVRRKLTYNDEDYQEFAEEMERRVKQRPNYSVAANVYDGLRHPYRRGRETATALIER